MRLCPALILVLLFAPTTSAEERPSVGKCLSPLGSLLQREARGKPWQPIREKADVPAGVTLLALPGVRAEIETAKGVRVSLFGNTPELSDVPVFESAAVLHEKDGFDLACDLLRGRVVFRNDKDKGPAKVHVHFEKEDWELTLSEPKVEVALELYGRWPGGVGFSLKPKKGEEPTTVVLLTVLNGAAELKALGRRHALEGPKGPAVFTWDSIVGPAPSPQKLAALPEWATEAMAKSEPARMMQERRKSLAERLEMKKSVPEALAGLWSDAAGLSDKFKAREVRRWVIFSYGATDDLAHLTAALADAKNPDIRATAVETLRQYIGRGVDEERAVYEALLKQENYSEKHAETVMQLLHTPFDAEQPVTYQLLIAYLGHEKIAVRELARWHLYRLVPFAKQIPYDAGGEAGARQKAVEEWKKRVPDGKVPR